VKSENFPETSGKVYISATYYFIVRWRHSLEIKRLGIIGFIGPGRVMEKFAESAPHNLVFNSLLYNHTDKKSTGFEEKYSKIYKNMEKHGNVDVIDKLEGLAKANHIILASGRETFPKFVCDKSPQEMVEHMKGLEDKLEELYTEENKGTYDDFRLQYLTVKAIYETAAEEGHTSEYYQYAGGKGFDGRIHRFIKYFPAHVPILRNLAQGLKGIYRGNNFPSLHIVSNPPTFVAELLSLYFEPASAKKIVAITDLDQDRGCQKMEEYYKAILCRKDSTTRTLLPGIIGDHNHPILFANYEITKFNLEKRGQWDDKYEEAFREVYEVLNNPDNNDFGNLEQGLLNNFMEQKEEDVNTLKEVVGSLIRSLEYFGNGELSYNGFFHQRETPPKEEEEERKSELANGEKLSQRGIFLCGPSTFKDGSIVGLRFAEKMNPQALRHYQAVIKFHERFWKNYLTPEVKELLGVQLGFPRGVDLMEKLEEPRLVDVETPVVQPSKPSIDLSLVEPLAHPTPKIVPPTPKKESIIHKLSYPGLDDHQRLIIPYRGYNILHKGKITHKVQLDFPRICSIYSILHHQGDIFLGTEDDIYCNNKLLVKVDKENLVKGRFRHKEAVDGIAEEGGELYAALNGPKGSALVKYDGNNFVLHRKGHFSRLKRGSTITVCHDNIEIQDVQGKNLFRLHNREKHGEISDYVEISTGEFLVGTSKGYILNQDNNQDHHKTVYGVPIWSLGADEKETLFLTVEKPNANGYVNHMIGQKLVIIKNGTQNTYRPTSILTDIWREGSNLVGIGLLNNVRSVLELNPKTSLVDTKTLGIQIDYAKPIII
jgi:tetratricopeptide (TPR) repeat protein